MKVRFISKETGRQIKSATIDESYVTSKRTALMEVCDEYGNFLGAYRYDYLF